jgi:hypothetical protein
MGRGACLFLMVPACSHGPAAAHAHHGYRLQGGVDPISASRGWTPIEHTDIRYDEDYARFYEAYAGAKKLPPPVEGRTLYSDLGILQQHKQLLQQAAAAGAGPTPSPGPSGLMLGGLTPGGEADSQQQPPRNSCTLAPFACWPDSLCSQHWH